MVSNKVYAQEHTIEYYEKQLLLVHDSLKPQLHNKLYWQYSKVDIEKAHMHAQKGLKLAKQLKNMNEEFGMLICLGSYYQSTGKLLLALQEYDKSLLLSDALSEFHQGYAIHTIAQILIELNPQRSFLLF